MTLPTLRLLASVPSASLATPVPTHTHTHTQGCCRWCLQTQSTSEIDLKQHAIDSVCDPRVTYTPTLFLHVCCTTPPPLLASQVLPLVPPDPEYFSPYSGLDTNCGNPLLIDLAALVTEGLLDPADAPPVMPDGDVQFEEVGGWGVCGGGGCLELLDCGVSYVGCCGVGGRRWVGGVGGVVGVGESIESETGHVCLASTGILWAAWKSTNASDRWPLWLRAGQVHCALSHRVNQQRSAEQVHANLVLVNS
jgi:hypothetical protein